MAMLLSGSVRSQMLTRYLPLWCLETSTRSSRGGLPMFASTWDLIFSVWLGTTGGSSLVGRGFLVSSIISPRVGARRCSDVGHYTRFRPGGRAYRKVGHGSCLGARCPFADPTIVDTIRPCRLVVRDTTVDPPDGSHDSASPGFQVALKQRRGTFAGQGRSQLAAEVGIFFVEELLAERIRHLDQRIQDILEFRGGRPAADLRRRTLPCFPGTWRRLAPLGQRRDDPKRLFRPVVLVVERSLDAAAKGDRIRGQQAVVNDPSPERQ